MKREEDRGSRIEGATRPLSAFVRKPAPRGTASHSARHFQRPTFASIGGMP